jgi:hypothetical protein
LLFCEAVDWSAYEDGLSALLENPQHHNVVVFLQKNNHQIQKKPTRIYYSTNTS